MWYGKQHAAEMPQLPVMMDERVAEDAAWIMGGGTRYTSVG